MSSHTPDNKTAITSLEQLRDFMLAGCKPRDRWVIGTEHEKFGWLAAENRHPPYGGPNGIGQLLLAFEAEGWEAKREGVAIIALSKDKASLTLEPGGQFELSGAPLRSLREMAEEFDQHLKDVLRLSEPLGISWHGLGSSPVSPELAPKMPKARYEVMRRYLPTRGERALHMMHSTCTIQCNLDYSSELDAMRKLRAGLYLQPLVMAMFANSFTLDQQLREGSCARSHIWLNTDPDRYCYPARFLEEGATLLDYVKWVIEVPMFFIAREGRYLDCAGLPFKRFMDEGFEGHSATMGDFELHLSTIFPDARLKQHLEVRGADMSSPEYVKALSAFHVGLLYDDDALQACLDRFEGVSAEALWALRARVDEEGLRATLQGQSLKEWGLEMIALSRQGLSRYEPGSEPLLDPLAEALRQGRCPADHARGLWPQGLEGLMRGTRLT